MRNKMRAFLTMLGIVIGISSVITMVGVGESSQASINNQVSQMGTNLIMVQRARMRERGVATGRDNVQSLKVKDVDLLADNCKYLSAVSPVFQASSQINNGNNNWSGSVMGGNTEHMGIRKFELATGSNFTDDDIKKYAKVALIGHTIVEELFDENVDPIGKTIAFVTHETDIAMFTSRIITLRDGHIISDCKNEALSAMSEIQKLKNLEIL